MIAVGRARFFLASPGTEPLFLHQSCYPFSSHMNALFCKLHMNTRTSIFPLMLCIRIFDTLGKTLVIQLSFTFASFTPIGIALFGDIQRLAEADNGKLMTMFMNELESYRWGCAKMLTAFFKISLSCRHSSFSRFNFLFSSSIVFWCPF